MNVFILDSYSIFSKSKLFEAAYKAGMMQSRTIRNKSLRENPKHELGHGTPSLEEAIITVFITEKPPLSHLEVKESNRKQKLESGALDHSVILIYSAQDFITFTLPSSKINNILVAEFQPE